MSQHRKNSVRDKVIGKKWTYLERHTFQNVSQKVRMALGETHSTGRVWAISEEKRPQNMG